MILLVTNPAIITIFFILLAVLLLSIKRDVTDAYNKHKNNESKNN